MNAPITPLTAVQQFKAARRVSAPIVTIRTADQFAAVESIRKSFNGNAPALLAWDAARGIIPLNEAGQDAFGAFEVDAMATINPNEALGLALKLPEGAVLFLYNIHRVLSNDIGTVSQAIWNCREEFKVNRRTLVLLAPDITLPTELQPDVLTIDEPLPTETQLRDILTEQLDAAGVAKQVDAATATRAVDAVSGLAAFPAEQAIALSLRPDGIDLDSLWDRKRQAIEQAPGLSVWRGGETFDDVGGCANVKQFITRLVKGKRTPRAVLFIDEIEKAMAGTQGDTSGVSQEMHGTMLEWMQNKKAIGLLFIGPPGAAKSAIAKATGNTAGCPTIQFDLSGMKGSLVGESGKNLRNALKVVDAVSQGRVLVVATCNSIGALSPELRRRFKYGTFFFDLPSAVEREAIWRIHGTRHQVPTAFVEQGRPKDEGWTGAEIETCCEIASDLGIPLTEAANYIVPVSKSAAETIAKLREQASGKFISASESGVYRMAAPTAPAASRARAYNEV